MLAFLIFAVTFLTVLLIVVVWLYPGSRKVTTIPGLDPSDPKDGNLADIAQAGSLHQFLQTLHDDNGPITSFWMGQQFVVSIASPELFKEHSKVFDRPNGLFLLFEPLITAQSIQFANGADGRQRRQEYDRTFSHDALDSYYSTFNKIGKDLLAHLMTIPKEEHIPLGQVVFAVAIKAITAASFGLFFNDEKEVRKLHQGYDICWAELESRLTGDVPSPDSDRQKRFDKNKNVIFDQMKKALEIRRAAGDTGENLLADILLASGKPESVIVADSVTYFVAGFHTTGLMLTWTMYYLALHPEVQEKVVQELNEVLGSEDVDGRVINDLVYMRQVLDETMRCSILAPYASRYQDIDIELGGHKVPAGTPVIHALGVVLQDEELYPEPTKFDPDRFSPEKRESLPKYAFEPFGFAGKRKCPGYRLTYAEATVFLAIILRKFKVKLVEGQVVTQEHGLVTKPKEEIWITIEKRNT